MKILKCLLPLVAGVFSVAAWSASEAGSSASSATSAASNSIGASSTSLTTSSNSSSNDNKVAAGDYLIIDVAVAAKDADNHARKDGSRDADAGEGAAAASATATARLTLRALNSDTPQRSEFVLVLPKTVVDKAGLAAGDTITARQRPYGLEFAAGATRQAFFLVLADTWYRELNTTAVTL